jgi:hypothetical protein
MTQVMLLTMTEAMCMSLREEASDTILLVILYILLLEAFKWQCKMQVSVLLKKN